MTSRQDAELLGMTVLNVTFSHAIILVFASGIQCFMCLYGLSRFLESPRESRKGRVPYIIASFVIFATFTLAAAIKTSDQFQMLLLVSNGRDLFRIPLQKDALKTVAAICNSIVFVIGDGLLLYRCYIVLHGRKWLAVIPTVTYVGTLAAEIAQFAANEPGPFLTATEAASAGLGALTNIFITAFITHRLLKAQKMFAAALTSSNRSSGMYRGVTQILVESAVPLTLSGIGYCATTFIHLGARNPSPPAHVLARILSAVSFFGTLHYAFIAISPQMIIFRVTTGRSWANSPEAESTRPQFSRPLVFARGTKNDESIGIGREDDNDSLEDTSGKASEHSGLGQNDYKV
ncbi:hypothetical protein FA15DRAFT_705454 [Coprinopsis marcescibilis]|uniref:Integral membrane protein n=1 Tax=Coprinopsis marcescibilis TaxID=230819 RepID=A0A5C3KTC0_COPMA|nr:hypothetical protein FA15DRAFT_705454 [Coprinopsis marcescibilis]